MEQSIERLAQEIRRKLTSEFKRGNEVQQRPSSQKQKATSSKGTLVEGVAHELAVIHE
jgi:hypothetical protein